MELQKKVECRMSWAPFVAGHRYPAPGAVLSDYLGTQAARRTDAGIGDALEHNAMVDLDRVAMTAVQHDQRQVPVGFTPFSVLSEVWTVPWNNVERGAQWIRNLPSEAA